jgi:acetoin utilization protein AcuB
VKIKERMSLDPHTVGPDASVDEALGIMTAHGVRHLPVVDDGKLVGLVTDTQLRSAWFPSLLEEVVVREVMTADPFTIDQESTVYQAARLLYNHKLTGLLVLDQGKLAGIITLADILGVFVDLLGLLTDSCRVDVALKPSKDSLENVAHLIRDTGGEVVSVALLSSEPSRRVYSFRLEKTPLEPIVEALKRAGHEVLD